jgi:cellulose synthase/poly-beta-1,6-N-acetylglucosamine synthase-like glycosyltransferase
MTPTILKEETVTFHAFARQSHRWLSILFTALSVILWAALGMGAAVPQWAYLLPLLPLALMMLTGLYMFFRPYVSRGAAG